MYDTYRSITSIPVKELEHLSLNEVAVLFQQSTDREFRNKCFAYVFKNVYPMLLGIHHNEKYAKLTHDDKTEECLCCTLYAMEHWTPKRGQKLSSYINMVVNSCFTTMLGKHVNCNKHKVFDNLIEADDKTLGLILSSIKDTNDKKPMVDLICKLDNSTLLTRDEKDYCKNLMNGYVTNKEMASQMKHITSIPRYNKKKKQFVSVPVKSEIALMNYCGQLKKSIQEKLTKSNREF